MGILCKKGTRELIRREGLIKFHVTLIREMILDASATVTMDGRDKCVARGRIARPKAFEIELKMSFARDASTVVPEKLSGGGLRFSARLQLTEAVILHIAEYYARDFTERPGVMRTYFSAAKMSV